MLSVFYLYEHCTYKYVIDNVRYVGFMGMSVEWQVSLHSLTLSLLDYLCILGHTPQSHSSTAAPSPALGKSHSVQNDHAALSLLYAFINLPDLSTVTEYLLDLSKPQVYDLGISLGLSLNRVRSEFDAALSTTVFLDNVITSWLHRVDQVDEKGGPSWKTLVAALRSRRLKQTGIANDVEKDHCMGKTSTDDGRK